MGVLQIFIDDTIAAFKGVGDAFASGSFDNIMESLGGLVWSPPLVILCLCAGTYFSIRTRFLQVRKVKKMVSLLFTGGSSDQGVSSFQAFAMSVAGRVGIGNIMGVATAIGFGGPGAMFWMWLIAFLGAGSAFVESTLAQLYKEELHGEYRGGPAYYFRALGFKKLAVVFMIATVFACGLALPGIQANSIGATMSSAFDISTAIPVGIVAVLIAFVVMGGTKGIAKVAEIVVPFMSGAYILVALIILAINITEIPYVFSLIFKSAFGLEAGLGGIIGSTILWGVKRGVFSNEAGQGTGAHPAAAAEVSHPAKQGLVQAFSVYFDTLFVCTATGLAIIVTNQFNILSVESVPSQILVNSSLTETSQFAASAFSTLLGSFGGAFIALSLFFFAFTTLIALYYYAETNLQLAIAKYSDQTRNISVWVLRIIYVGAVVLFGLRSSGAAWGAADMGVGLMAWINIVGILIIAKPALLAFKDFERRQKAGTDDEWFTVDDMPAEERAHMKNVTFWTKENLASKIEKNK